jgi:hypothetical protein
MNEEKPGEVNPVRGGRNLKLLFGLAVAGTVIIVGVSLALYYTSGTYLLDLSRPGQGVEGPLAEETWAFPAEGDLNQADLQEFIDQFSGMRGRINDTRAFTDDSLSDEGLRLK